MGLVNDSHSPESLRLRLHEISMRVTTARDRYALARAMKEYMETAGLLDSAMDATAVAAPYIPGAAVVSAAVTGLPSLESRWP